MSKVLIIFGSTSGNTELVSEKVAEVLRKKKHQVDIQRAELSKLEDINKYDFSILAASTYGHGILQDHMIPINKAVKNTDLSGKKFAVIGLGDNKYDNLYNIESAHILEESITKSGGELVLDALKINKSPILYLQNSVTKWAENLAKKI